MPYWYYDKKDLQNTPSFQDGISNETENRYRKEGARFIIDTGSKMDLAGKVEETPKKCKDIIKVAKSQLAEEKFASFGEDPKEEVMTLERILLQTIKFDLQVEHPYGYLLKYAKCLKGDKGKLQKMVQMAWTFVNDSLCTTLSLQWEPEVIAVALMFLAGKLSKFEVEDWNGRLPKHNTWWDMFVEDITTELLEDICHQVLDLYSPQTQSGGSDSPPMQNPATKPPKNEKAPPSVTPPASVSPVAPPPAKAPATSTATVTPIKNGAEKKLEPPRITEPPRYFPPTYALPGFPLPPPPMPPMPRPPPLVFSEPPPTRFPVPPVNVPPPINYFSAGLHPVGRPPPPRPYYPPPQ